MKPNDKAYQEAADEIRFNSGLDLSEDVCSELAKLAVDAAFSAQFKCEDYVGLVKELRSMHKQITSAIKKDDPWAVIDETVPSKAADAIEALLADRDALKAELAAANTRMSKLDFERTAAELDRDAIRDALAARLAPVKDEALVEIAAKRMCINDDDDEELIWSNATHTQKEYYLTQARAAISAIRPHIEAAERERCAKIAEGSFLFDIETWLNSTKKEMTAHVAKAIAAAIRSGK